MLEDRIQTRHPSQPILVIQWNPGLAAVSTQATKHALQPLATMFFSLVLQIYLIKPQIFSLFILSLPKKKKQGVNQSVVPKSNSKLNPRLGELLYP